MKISKIVIYILVLCCVSGNSFCYSKIDKEKITMNKILSRVQELEMQLNAKIGIYALYSKNNKIIGYNEEFLFPMASTRKVAIATKFLSMVEAGFIDIDEQITLKPNDWRPGSGILSNRLVFNNISLPLSEYLRLMLEVSDNTATDIITNKVGGPNAVTKWLAKMGIANMRLDRNSLQLKADYDGLKSHNLKKLSDKAFYENSQKLISENEKNLARKNFLSDLQDSTTPKAMGELLNEISGSELININSKNLFLKHLQLNQKSINRISLLLPYEAMVAHKGGTLGEDKFAITNDVSIITFPKDKDYMVMAIFIKSDESSLKSREEVIAKIALLIFDYLTK